MRLMQSAVRIVAPPMLLYLYYQLIRINNEVFVCQVDASGVGYYEEYIPERVDE